MLAGILGGAGFAFGAARPGGTGGVGAVGSELFGADGFTGMRLSLLEQ